MNVTQALERGRYVKAVAVIEQTGISIDTVAYEQIRENWNEILLSLIQDYDKIGVYDATTFKSERFFKYLSANGISWPKTKHGKHLLTLETFEEQARSHAEIASIYQVRKILSQLRTFKLPIGQDGRNHFSIRAFTAKTSRNQPRSSECIFGLSSWVRNLIKPEAGKALAYIDWSQQEFGIGAVLSQDQKMITAYKSGDPYLDFGKKTELIPPNGNKNSCLIEREICKSCILGLQYGMTSHSLAKQIKKSLTYAQKLIDQHKTLYKTFWDWNDSYVKDGKKCGYEESKVGWRMIVDESTNERTLQNFPMQSNGAEMLRLACCLAVESGIKVCCPVHDALLVEAEEDQIDVVVNDTVKCMDQASKDILSGFVLRTDAETIVYPEHFLPAKGKDIWNRVQNFLSCDEKYDQQ